MIPIHHQRTASLYPTMPENATETMTAAEYRALRLNTAGEDDIHKAVIQWARAKEGELPGLKLLFHPANGGKRTGATGALMKAFGQKKGVPDILVMAARSSYSGLALELKSASGRVRPTQAWWLLKLRCEGYATDVAYTYEEATRILTDYCAGANTNWSRCTCPSRSGPEWVAQKCTTPNPTHGLQGPGRYKSEPRINSPKPWPDVLSQYSRGIKKSTGAQSPTVTAPELSSTASSPHGRSTGA